MGPKTAQEGLKTAQEGPKMAPTGAQENHSPAEDEEEGKDYCRQDSSPKIITMLISPFECAPFFPA